MKLRLSKLLPRRRWQRWTLALLLVVGLAYVLVPLFAAPYVRGKLQAMVAGKLDAELQMGSLRYLPPFGVRVRDARIVTRAPDSSGNVVELLKLARLDLRLAKLPFGEGPLIIERIEVQQPEVHLILTEGGLIGVRPATPEQKESQKLPRGTKLSDMFELRHFALWGGRVVLEDRRRPGSVPMVWSELKVGTETTQTSKSSYAFRMTADHRDVAALNASGSFDLDALHLKLDDAQLAIGADPAQPTSALPAQFQDAIRTHRVKGKLGIRAAADVSFQNLAAATFDAKLDLSGASAYFPKTDSALEQVTLVLRCRTVPATERPETQPAAGTRPSVPSTVPTVPAIHVELERFEVASGPASLSAKIAKEDERLLIVDRAGNRWTLNELAGVLDFGPTGKINEANAASSDHGGLIDRFALAGRVEFSAAGRGPLKLEAGQDIANAMSYRAVLRPDGLRVRPPKTPLPFENLGGGGTLELSPGLLTIKGLTATYGGDGIVLRAARVPLPADLTELKDAFAIEEIDASIDFHRPNPQYPGGFGKVVNRLRPAGVFDIGGGSYFRVARVPPADDGTAPDKLRKGDWFFGVSTDDGSFLLTDKRIPLDHIRGDATVSTLLVDIPNLECTILGGTGAASGTITPRKPYAIANGRVVLRDVNLAELARTLEPDHPNNKLVGRGSLNFVLDGNLATDEETNVKPADALRGRGEFEVVRGHFWTLPVLGKVASESKKNGPVEEGGALTLGEAAGVFRIADRMVFLDNAAVNSPALGLVGSGSIGFDKSLDLQIVAAPLGDWRDHVKRSRIPIVSDIAGEVVGGVQKLLNVATRTLLYQFRVRGTISDPDVQTVPAPVLTDPAALLFGRMLDSNRKAPLIESVRTESTK